MDGQKNTCTKCGIESAYYTASSLDGWIEFRHKKEQYNHDMIFLCSDCSGNMLTNLGRVYKLTSIGSHRDYIQDSIMSELYSDILKKENENV